mmetsp:Transcript_28459/g.54277  ORF Transcript_28459/g.54277 Transcript_28459/m.54277 type:complete len:204 (+) Transcript_28459:1599-2210(+)
MAAASWSSCSWDLRLSMACVMARACSCTFVRVKILRISTMDGAMSLSASSCSDVGAGGGTWAAVSSICSSRISCRRFSLPWNMLFCTARPRTRRCTSTTAARRATASRSCSSAGVSGRSGPRCTRRPVTFSFSSRGAGQQSPWPRSLLASALEAASTCSMCPSCLATNALCRSCALAGRCCCGGLVVARIDFAGMLASSSSTS